MKIRLLVILLLLSSYVANSQQYKAVPISLADGLSQSSVYDIIQDKSGFTWIATQDGLNRYDGTSFEIFRDEPFDTNSISSNYTDNLICDSKGRIWAGTANHGLNLYIPGKVGFQHFFSGQVNGTLASNIITCLYEDSQGTIWVGTGNGLHRVIETKIGNQIEFTFENISLKTNPEDSVSDKYINVITSDNDRRLWVGSYSGLFKLELNDNIHKAPETVWFSKKNNRIINFAVFSITIDKSGRVWTAGRNGIDIISYPGESIRHISALENNQTGMAGNQVTSLLTASNGDVWVGYNDQGVQVVRNRYPAAPIPDTIKFERISLVTPLNTLTKGNAISFWEDRITKGLIWVGFNAGGAVRLIPVTKNFVTNNLAASPLSSPFVTCLLKQDRDEIWIGTPTGLLNYNRTSNKYETFFPVESGEKYGNENYINGIVLTSRGNVVIGSGNRLFIVEKKNGTKTYKPISIPDEVDGNSLRTLVSGTNERVFVVSRYAIYEFNPASELFTKVIRITDQKKLGDKSFYMSSFFMDHAGNYWVGTSNGLDYYPKKALADTPDLSRPVSYFHNPKDTNSLRNQNILCIAEDKEHNMWLGTMNGLTRVFIENGEKKFQNFSTRNGLKNNVIYAIVPDSKTGHLWLSTNNGLTEFDPSGIAIATYDIHDGLQSNEFNSYAAFKAADGEMFFGGIEGYTSFYPEQIKRDITSPLISITNIILNGNRYLNLADYQQSKTIDLKYKDNSFTVNFIGLHYVDPQKNQYAYKLEGFQSDWIYAGNSTLVNYSQLPPGRYVFRVKAANSDGMYTSEGDMFVINVQPPFYKTIWFYLIIAVFIAGILWGLHKYRLSMKLEQVREVEKIRRATAADFHDELGHKLTIISWFAEILKKKIGPEQIDLRPHLDRIIDASGTLYHTMKDMLWAMDPDKDSVYDLYSQIREFGLELFDNTGVLFDAENISDELKEKIISPAHKRHVLLIFKEVMHNSLKHAHSTNTHLDLVKDENRLKFRFRDNGTGFKMNGHNVGHGLNNVKRRAQMIHGEMIIHSEGDGTVAELDLAFDRLN